MKIADFLRLWGELAEDRRADGREVRRRIQPDAVVDLFAVHSMASNAPGLSIGVTAPMKPQGTTFKPCRGVAIESHTLRNGDSYHTSFSIALEDPQLLGVFAVLCADLVSTVTAESNPGAAYAAGVNRLVRWLIMFDHLPAEGLSREARLGLFGEVYVISMLSEVITPDQAVAAWRGWDSSHQDFKLGNVGLEVKTSSAKLHARIRIANEKQLDERPWSKLVLTFVQVDVNVPGGRTLPSIIRAVREDLLQFPAARYEFDQHLLQAGYTDAQGHLYEDDTYAVRAVTFFDVHEEFPRLTGANLPSGVGDIAYTIIASDIESYKLDAEQFQGLIKGEIA